MTQVEPGSRLPVEKNSGSSTVTCTYRCDHCHRRLVAYINVDREVVNTNSPDEWIDLLGENVRWSPRIGIGKTFADVPTHAAQAASEAHECQSINAHRAAVLLARAVIEATAKEKGITSGNLRSKIDKLSDQQFIRPHIRDEAHEVRYLGNDMAHSDFVDPVTKDAADAVLLIMGEVLNEVFQGPAVAERLRKRRQGDA